ncbi:MAG: hypothetical protein SFU98_09460 [Leptospiraceae bacterium]|nr:hypothetical protein [Leptospiraceae bacterium]
MIASIQQILYNRFFLLICITKILVLFLFSSDYQDRLFFPFVNGFLNNLENPWDRVILENPSPSPFPYPPMMLGLLSICSSIIKLLSENILVNKFFFKLPLLLADIGIFFYLNKLFPNEKKKILIYYFLSPIIFYSIFMHGQLDIIPTAFLFASIYYLNRHKLFISNILISLAIGTKFHNVMGLPLVLIFIYRNFGIKNAIQYFLITFFIIFVSILPVFNSIGFQELVLKNEQQRKILNSFFDLGGFQLNLPILFLGIIYTRFLSYTKINWDLLHSFLGIAFLIILALVPPAPGWFVWVIPFYIIFLLKTNFEKRNLVYLYSGFSFFYLVFFLLFSTSELIELKFLDQAVDWKINSIQYKNIFYTILIVLISVSILSFYRFGVKSNSIYRNEKSIVIGIAGDSSTGKSTLLSDIKNILGLERVVEIEGDGDHKWERGDENWTKVTHLNPKANFLHRQAEQLILLKNRDPIARVDYDHETGKFTSPIIIESKDYIVLSGLHAFYLPFSRRAVDIKIYTDTDEKLRKHWKILRDTKYRGYSNKKILEQIKKRELDAVKYIHPQKEFADIKINYFTKDNFILGKEDSKFNILLKVHFNSDLNIDFLVSNPEFMKSVSIHDYTIDMKSQVIEFNSEPNMEKVLLNLNTKINNIDELMGFEPIWSSGYRSFLQLLVLLHIAEKKKYQSRII